MAKELPTETIELIAQRFRAMGEPMRLRILMALRADGDPVLEEQKRQFRLRAAISGIPVYDELNNAGGALAAPARTKGRKSSDRPGRGQSALGGV